jgi:hypothetical protein
MNAKENYSLGIKELDEVIGGIKNGSNIMWRGEKIHYAGPNYKVQ